MLKNGNADEAEKGISYYTRLEKFSSVNEWPYSWRDFSCIEKSICFFTQKTTDAFVNFIDSSEQDWANGCKEVKAVFIVLKNAFATIEQNMLLEKLENLLMRESTKFSEILFEEDNNVLNQLVRSDFLPVEYGVTNRSVLIPPLVLVFLNNIQESCGDSSATLRNVLWSKMRVEVN